MVFGVSAEEPGLDIEPGLTCVTERGEGPTTGSSFMPPLMTVHPGEKHVLSHFVALTHTLGPWPGVREWCLVIRVFE